MINNIAFCFKLQAQLSQVRILTLNEFNSKKKTFASYFDHILHIGIRGKSKCERGGVSNLWCQIDFLCFPLGGKTTYLTLKPWGWGVRHKRRIDVKRTDSDFQLDNLDFRILIN